MEVVSAAVRAASHTRVAHKDFPADEWLETRTHADRSRDGVALRPLPEGIEAARPSVCALRTSFIIVGGCTRRKPHAARARSETAIDAESEAYRWVGI